MTPIRRIEGRAYRLDRANVDTDLIIPAEHLKTTSRHGLGPHAFSALRSEPGNPFDHPEVRGAPILIAGENFGCGSSREHAVWALLDLGIRAVIAPSFSDIFAGNAFKNGVLTAQIPTEGLAPLLRAPEHRPVCVDLERLVIGVEAGPGVPFSIDEFRRECLLKGLDEIALTLAHEEAIRAYEGCGVGPPTAPHWA